MKLVKNKRDRIRFRYSVSPQIMHDLRPLKIDKLILEYWLLSGKRLTVLPKPYKENL